MATGVADDAVHKRPWLGAVLSAVIPGAGQAYAGRWLRAIVWFAPAIASAVALIPLASVRTSDLVGAALEPRVLWTIFGANVLAGLWRIAAAVDAYLVCRTSHRSRVDAIAITVGAAVLFLAVAVPHILIGRYTYDTITLVESVFVVGEPVDDAPPRIPIGTDADIVPDPIVRTYEAGPVDPRSTRNLIFRVGFGDPDAVDSWNEIVAAPADGSLSAPFEGFDERVGTDRITILFAGGDAGPGRGGLRTDSMMVGTIDTTTGKAALFSFPRNMAQIPLPSRFSNAFVDLQRRLEPPAVPAETTTTTGAVGEGEDAGDGEGAGQPPANDDEIAPPAFVPCKCFPEQLNAIYPFTRRWDRTYPNEPDPGMAALRDVLAHLMGTSIDYYALIDMAAFVDLVDAIGGVDVFVLEPMESEVSPPREGEPWAYVKVEPGWNHLDGPQALAYARARKGSSDYARMARQRCMVKAVAAKADPITVLRSFPAIVKAIDGAVVTDIPLTFVPDLIEAAAGLDFDDIETVGLTHSYWQDERDAKGHPIPDIDRIRSKVSRVLAGQSTPDSEVEVSSECDV